MKTIQRLYTYIFLLLFSVVSLQLKAQANNCQAEPFREFHNGLELYEESVFGMARISFTKFLKEEVVSDPSFSLIKKQAEIYQALCALHLDDPEGEPLVDSWMRTYPQEPMFHKAGFELGSYYYNEKRYKDAVEAFNKINPSLLSVEQEAELYFKKGYCLFVQRDFSGAKEVFLATKDVRNQYFDSVNYYYGMCNYFTGDYDEAIASFDRCLNSPNYRAHVPYYIAQIYFEQEKYEHLIQFTQKYLDLEDIKKQPELHQLVGQSYFIKEDYAAAVEHLEYYEQHSKKLTEEEFYQLAFAQYQTGNYPKAIENFLELSLVDNPKGQSSNYYLADCYLSLGDKASAMAAFKQVSQSPYDKFMQDEAMFAYAKLAAELNLENEAISTLLKIGKSSSYFASAQDLLSELLIRTKDYVKAIDILKSINPRSPKLESAYQKANFLQASQFMQDGKTNEAVSYYQSAIKTGDNLNLTAQSYFWIAKFLHNSQDYKQSQINFESYFNISTQLTALPFESSPAVARYLNAYNYFKLQNYEMASKEFDKSTQLLEKVKSDNPLKIRFLSDGYIRSADCHFKNKNYTQALHNYEKAIQKSSTGGAYAYYQKASVEGLLNKPFDKILSLEEMINAYPNSSLTDDALLQLGNTYLSMGNKGLAEKVFRKLVSDFKDKSNLINPAYLKLGLISYNLGDAKKALEYYESVINNNPTAKESHEAMLAIEEIYVEDLGDSEAYIAFVESVPGYDLSEYSKDSISYYIAENQFKNGNYQTAVEGLSRYIERYPKGFYNVLAYYHRAESYSLLKEYSPALGDYQQVIDFGVSEKYESALAKAALISYNHEQNFEKAYQYYTEYAAFTVDPITKRDAQDGALNSASRIPDYKKVILISDLQLSDSLLTDNEIAHIYYLKGKAHFELQDMVEAIRSLKNASDEIQNLEAAEARFLIGQILYDLQDYEESEMALKNAIRQNKSYSFWVARSLILLSDVYVAQNSLLKARAAIEAVIENYKGDETILAISKQKLKELEQLEEAQNRIKSHSISDTLELENGQN